MTTLTEARADLVARLEGLVYAVDHVPEELPAGVCAVVDADEPFLTLGETFGAGPGAALEDEPYGDGAYGGDLPPVDVWVSFKVFVLAELTSNLQATQDLDQTLGTVLAALAASDWEVGPIGKPGPFHTTTWLAHGVAIPVSTILTLT